MNVLRVLTRRVQPDCNVAEALRVVKETFPIRLYVHTVRHGMLLYHAGILCRLMRGNLLKIGKHIQVWLGALLLAVVGCHLKEPTLLPVSHSGAELKTERGKAHIYHIDDEPIANYVEVVSDAGRVVEIGYGVGTNGQINESVLRVPGNANRCRRVLIILDSIPFHLVQEAYDSGRFRNFYPPSRVIAPFPVMTDLCLNEFFGTSPATAVETEYFDGERLRDGWFGYAESDNSLWLSKVDVSVPFSQHNHVYMDAANWFGHELALIEEALVEGDCGETVGYVVSTSALGVSGGRNGHVAGLVTLDRFCQALMHRFRGDIEITLLSDHGHNLRESRRLSLREALDDFGYDVGARLEDENDVVIPEFGLVSCAVMYSNSPGRLARDLAAVEGVELVAFRFPDGAIGVVDRGGEAIVTARGLNGMSVPHPSASLRDGAASPGDDAGALLFRYDVLRGDPLRMVEEFNRLKSRGKVDSDGFVRDADLRDASIDLFYPDVLYRLHRAFEGLVVHTPQVLVSIEDGWYAGSPFMSQFLKERAIHGNLNENNSFAFVMSTQAQLPVTLRMDEVLGELQLLGIVRRDY